ncbi:hypothetical protein [Rhodococcus sp. UNC23MFCrub1.1]|uniref:hypothetical protein n=1 Tax=Rhodococcus sp. UNC23MFCrub1.1 TaxID=1449068 RepID=UPI0004872FB4|nr:hypothetical protein [Rhodococcus sp. UNC23MFCrub1.1]
MTARAALVAGSAALYVGAAILLVVDQWLRRAARGDCDASRDRLDAAIVCAVLASVFAVAAAET